MTGASICRCRPAAAWPGWSRNPYQAGREIWLLQRKDSKPGKNLGKTTGGCIASIYAGAECEALSGVRYLKVDDAGLHIEHEGVNRVLEVDNVVVCAGQLSNRALADAVEAAGGRCHVIGGAFEARELDAKHAIRQGSELAARL